MLDEYIAINNKKTAYRIIDGEATVVNLNDSIFHTLNPVATFIWQNLDGQKSVKTIIQGIITEFEVDPVIAEKDCLDFIQTLVNEDLVIKSLKPIKES